MKKLLITISLLLALVPAQIFADTNNSSEDYNEVKFLTESQNAETFKSPESIHDLGRISYQTKIEINGDVENLYPTFENSEKALQLIAVKQNTLLDEMKSKYELGDFSENTWNDYFENLPIYEEYIEAQCDRENKDELLNVKIPQLYEFFDIYENVRDNNLIIQEFKEASEISKVENSFIRKQYKTISRTSKDKINPIADEELNDVVWMLPESLSNENVAEVASAKSAISYAEKWAESYNSTYAKYTYDCTNFGSQIKRAGGAAMNPSNDENKGWWFRTNGTKASSRSWRVATDFGKYFGKSYTSSNFKTFSNKLSAGKFIGYDRTGDKNVDHIGFVTDTSGVLKNTNGASYYNFKVAQHTSNYNAWVSNETNGWDKLHSQYPDIEYNIIK